MDISAYQHMNFRISTRGKRPLRNLTPGDKVRAIQRIHNGETKASVSRDIGVPESTLRGWCKNEQKLRFMCRQLGTDQIPLSLLENPPEKRTKLESHLSPPKFGHLTSYEAFGYNRLPLSGLDFLSNNNNSNAILEKMAINDYINKSNFHDEASKHFSNSVNLEGLNTIPDYSQFSVMQNINFMSLINPNMTSLADVSPVRSQSEIPPINISNTDNKLKDNNNTKNSPIALSVRNWARDPAEDLSYKKMKKKRNSNDTNNNDVKSMQLPALDVHPHDDPVGIIPSFLPSDILSLSHEGDDSEGNNAILVEWCKMFNASLSFLALAAAAAALQKSSTPTPDADGKNTDSAEQDCSEENMLLKHLKAINSTSFFVPNDISNDSYFDSEPEDLSIRSTTSKISSATNSRSQSPTKSTECGSTTPSDNEE